MKQYLMRTKRSKINAFFGIIFTILYLLVLLPPIYIGISHIHVFVLGLPLTAFYMIADAFLVTLAVWALWWVEKVRNEL